MIVSMASITTRFPALQDVLRRPFGHRTGFSTRSGAVPSDVRSVAVIPSEQVLLLSVELPRLTSAQRRVAVAFAVEDRIARPLDDVHVIAGERLDASAEGQRGRWLVAVVGKQTLADHFARWPLADGQRLLPDCLALPVPQPGQWSVAADAGRVLLRLPDGTGMALGQASFAGLHKAAGTPELVLVAGALPPDFTPTIPATPSAAGWPKTLDLGSVLYDRREGRLPAGIKRLGYLALGLSAAWLFLGAVDMIALSRLQSAREATLRSLFVERGTPISGDMNEAINASYANSQSPAQSQFLPLLSRIFTALAPQIGSVVLQDLQFDSAARTVSLTLQAPNISMLQQLETQFAAAGFAVVAGSASNADGLAVQQFALRGDGS